LLPIAPPPSLLPPTNLRPEIVTGGKFGVKPGLMLKIREALLPLTVSLSGPGPTTSSPSWITSSPVFSVI